MTENLPTQLPNAGDPLRPRFTSSLNAGEKAWLDQVYPEGSLEQGMDWPQIKLRKQLRLFLANFIRTGMKIQSAQAAGFDSGSAAINQAAEMDRQFAVAYKKAIEVLGDMIEDEATRRAVYGVEKHIYHRGKSIGTEQVYSDTLMKKLLDGARPEKYAPKQRVEHSVPKDNGGGSLSASHGVVVLPTVIVDARDWERQSEKVLKDQQASQGQIIDADE